MTNDRNQPLEGDWMVENASFSGAVAMQTDVHAQIAAQASQCIAAGQENNWRRMPGHYLWVEEKNNLTRSTAIFLFRSRNCRGWGRKSG